MAAENTLTALQILHNDFYVAKKLLYDKCGFELCEINAEPESREYGACNFKLNGNTIKFRVSKTTPKKAGQFVTIWKRNEKGKTKPFEETDEIDFIVICSGNGSDFGQFIFPKSVLIDNGIITGKNKKGKCGIRVYPPWDKTTNKQAMKTQSWQIKYFLNILNYNLTDFDLIMKLFTKSKKAD